MIVRVPREQASNSSSSLVLAAQPPTAPASPRDGYAHGRLPCAVRAPEGKSEGHRSRRSRPRRRQPSRRRCSGRRRWADTTAAANAVKDIKQNN